MSDWQPIKTAPKDGRKILMFWAGEQFVGSYRLGMRGQPEQDEVMWRAVCCGRYAAPTHWKPLDEPPTVTQKNHSV